jgi:branched-subunit amino acid permease
VKEIHCERNTVENTYTVVFLTVLLLFTYPFVRLSCYAATSHSHSVSMSEETNQVISMNVVGFQIMFTVVCYFIFNT